LDLDQLIKEMNTRSKDSSMVPKTPAETFQIEPEFLKTLMHLCESKAEEFLLIGYDKVSKEDIWRYISHKYSKGLPSLHRVVNEILGLKITTYMNWATINAYKGI
jgi:hypothetical protein